MQEDLRTELLTKKEADLKNVENPQSIDIESSKKAC